MASEQKALLFKPLLLKGNKIKAWLQSMQLSESSFIVKLFLVYFAKIFSHKLMENIADFCNGISWRIEVKCKMVLANGDLSY